MRETKKLADEAKEHLLTKLLPFWTGLIDEEYGGYYGFLDYDLKLDKRAVKGCILNSRITWFFSNAALLYRDGLLTEEECRAAGFSGKMLSAYARHGYRFLKERCLDRENGGVFWSLNYDGTPADTTKHTYNQAFAVYALSSYFAASGDYEAFALAAELIGLIEGKCADQTGYLEAFTADFLPEENDKLSENGVMADRTMNTLLHVLEAYTEFVRVTENISDEWVRGANRMVRKRLERILDLFAEKIYNPKKHRLEVFFDRDYNSILDLHSYGHDIEASWLIDRSLFVLGKEAYEKKLSPVTAALADGVYKEAFDGHSLANECDRGKVDGTRVWWVQAEAVTGFLNAWRKNPKESGYLSAASFVWEYIMKYVVDKREGSEWFENLFPDNRPDTSRPIVQPWKCPYHNGRLCFELIRRDAEEMRDKT